MNAYSNEKLLSTVVDTKKISISDAFRYLIKGEKEEFINKNTDNISFKKKKELMVIT